MIARPKGPTRKIKRTVQEKTDPQSQKTLKYQFYRDILHPTILKLKNEMAKLNYSTWLARLDLEDVDKKILLIKMLIISLKNKEPFHVFAKFPPKDLSELNLYLEDNNAMVVLKILQDDTNFLLAHKIVPQENRYKRSAAVATDMRSYISIKSSPHLIQSFYAKSDFSIRLWDNPATIILPISNIDHNQWDLYMNHFNILSQKKTDGIKHQNDCQNLKVDQVSKEVTTSFRWHPNSLLLHSDRPKRSACFLEADQDIANQPVTQELIENAAFDIVYEKSFPGHKILNSRIYCTLMMPDPKYVFTMTNVKIIYNNSSHIAFISYKQKNLCKKRNVKVPDKCLKTDECKSICILPLETQYPCSEITMHNSNPFQKTCNTTCPATCNSTTLPKIITVKTKNDSEYMQSNQTHPPYDKTFACSRFENKSLECDETQNVTNFKQNMSSKNQSLSNNSQSNLTHPPFDKTFACSRSENKSLEHDEKQNETKCEKNMSSKKQSMPNNSLCCSISSQNHTNSKQYNTINNNQTQAHSLQKSNMCNSSLDDSSNYDWTMSYVESSPNQNVAQDSHCRPNDSIKLHAERRCNQLPCLDSTNRNHQVQEHEERQSHCNNRHSLPAMNSNCLNITDTITRPKFDENFDPNISSYSKFSNRNNRSGGPKEQTVQKTSSYHNFPNNNNNYFNDDTFKSDESLDFSSELDFRPMRPICNCDYSGSQMTSTSCPNSSLGNFDTDNNNINEFVGPLPIRNNNSNMKTCGCQIDNIQSHDLDDLNIKDIMDINSDWENETFNDLPQYNNEYRNMPSNLMSFPRDDFQDLENMTMPNNSYEPYDSNNMVMDDYSDIRNMSMPNNSLDELSDNC